MGLTSLEQDDGDLLGLSWRDALAYIPAQVAGCVLGAITANGMFALAAVSISTHHPATPAHLFSEVIATAGLLLVIFSLARPKRLSAAPAAVGAYIGAAYFVTSSASFANPAITVGRMFSDTFAGIAPASVPGYVVAQLVGGACAILAIRVLYPDVTPADAGRRRRAGGPPPRANSIVLTWLRSEQSRRRNFLLAYGFSVVLSGAIRTELVRDLKTPRPLRGQPVHGSAQTPLALIRFVKRHSPASERRNAVRIESVGSMQP